MRLILLNSCLSQYLEVVKPAPHSLPAAARP